MSAIAGIVSDNCSIIDFYFYWKYIGEVKEAKFNIVWYEVPDDQLESYGDFLDNFSNELWADFISCNIIICDNTLHHH